MFDVFGSVKSLMKLDSVCIDNNVFRLHYKVSVIILVAFSLLVTSRQYIGKAIIAFALVKIYDKLFGQEFSIYTTIIYIYNNFRGSH